MQTAENKQPCLSIRRSRPFQPLRERIIAWQLLYCFITGLAVASAQLVFHFLDKREHAIDVIISAANTHLPQLANRLARQDMTGAKEQLDAIGRFPTVGYVILTLPSGEKIKAGRQADRWGHLLLDKFSSWSQAVPDPHHPTHSLAQLRIYANRSELRDAVAVDALRIIASQAVGIFILALLMARISNRFVGRHLTHIAKHISALNPIALNQKLELARRPRLVEDEFDQLCTAFNRLNNRLVSYIDSHRILENELRNHRDGLSVLIAERTISLERLKDFHSLIITMLTRFMNLPPDQANSAVDEGLAAFCDYFEAPRCILFTLDEASRGYCIANVWPRLPETASPVKVWLASDTLLRQSTGVRGAKIWLSTKAVAEDEVGNADSVLTLLKANACTIVSIEIMDRAVGLLCLVGKALAPDSDNANLLELAARVAANMLDHKVAQLRLLETQQALEAVNLELNKLSRFDPLTGLANRRRFDEIKLLEFSRAVRAESPLAVLMCDIDHFKLYNDTYGHAQGDRCLKTLADTLTTLFARAGELPARLGGEEFAVLLPGATEELALSQAERLRQAVWDLAVPHAASPVADRVTISIGVACLRHEKHLEFDSLLLAADEALYVAKTRRNFVSLA
jgi:diguanylate cyclase (GGDEF)-like protein